MPETSRQHSEQPLLRVMGIRKQYPGTLALNDVDFDVRAGEVHALVGENGAGKSTLMLIMAGILEPDRGQMRLNGDTVAFKTPAEAQRAGISIVFQELAVAPNMSISENIFRNTQPTNELGFIRFAEMHARARKVLGTFGIDVDPREPLRRYSLALRQIVEIASSIERDAQVLLLDEPTSAIGGEEIDRLFRVIQALRREGVGIVYVSHKLDEVMQIADRISVLRDGNLVGCVQKKGTSEDELVRMMVGREFEDLYPPHTGKLGETMLRVEGLTGARFTNISFRAHAGQILGLFGLTGAGRTELARAVFGVDPVSGGKVSIGDQKIPRSDPRASMEAGIAYIPEDRKEDGLFLRMSLKENIAATNLKAVSRGMMVDRSKLRELSDRMVDSLGIRARSLSQQVSYLSGGNQQKVLFAKWISRKPRVLLADEPTRGVDVGAKADIHRLLRDAAQEGAAVVMISSELPEIMELSDRIAVMSNGVIRGVFDADEATEERLLALAAQGETEAKQ